MSRLIAFGCSHTFGAGLSDTYPLKKHPSKQSWPAILGEKLDIEVCNEGIPAAGNAEIFDKILRYDFLPTDLIIIMWSHFVRYDDFVIEDQYRSTRQWRKNFKNQEFDDKIDYHNAYKNYLIFQHCELLLSCKKLQHYSTIAWYLDSQLYPKPEFIELHNMIDLNIHSLVVDKGLDQMHFGPKTHEKVAECFYAKVKDNVIR